MKNTKIILILILSLIIPFNRVFAKWACAFVVYNKNTYVITDRKMSSELIGSEIGHVTRYSTREGTYSGNFSNTYPKGTKYYEIKGSDINKAIAVKNKDGSFAEARYEHEYEGGRYDISAILMNSGGIILALLLIWLIVRRKIRKT